MRMKMFVPSFDDDFLEIVITQWLKKEMDTVTKGELIAVAETYQTSCEITAEHTGILCEISLPEKSICRSGDVLCSIFEGTLEEYQRFKTQQENNISEKPLYSQNSDVSHDNDIVADVLSQIEERTLTTAKPLVFESVFIASRQDEANNETEKTHHTTASSHHTHSSTHHTKTAEHHTSTSDHHAKPEDHHKHASVHHKKTTEHHEKSSTKHSTTTHHKKDDDTLPGADPYTWNYPQFFEEPNAEKVPLNPMRQKILDNMRNALHESFLCSVMDEVDMSSILQIQKVLGNDFENKHHIPLGFTAFFVKAIIGALKQYPVFNAYVRQENIVYRKECDISLYMQNSSKMVAPVLRGTEKMSIMMLQKNIIALNKRAHAGELTLEECNRGSFSIINAGIYGALFSTDIVPPLQVAALSIHKLQRRAVVIDDRIEIRPMTYISMTYDHRVADISEAASFLSNVKRYVENPSFAMLDLT